VISHSRSELLTICKQDRPIGFHISYFGVKQGISIRTHHLAGKNRGKAGFTLIEILVVLVIVAILSVISVPAYNRHVVKGRQAEAQRGLVGLAQTEEMVRFQTGNYTATLATLRNLGWTGNTADQGLTPRYAYVVNVGVDGTGAPIFTATATGNIDGDGTVDTWTINQDGTLTNTVNDVTQ
jgi:prepilin-type N-terminal cleavage/methylation domain-containing protein